MHDGGWPARDPVDELHRVWRRPRPVRQDLRVFCAMSFHSIYAHGFARVAACVTTSHVADPAANAKAVIAAAKTCDAQSVAVSVFPELCLSGYAIEDLVKQDPLLDAVERGLV